ncbi:MAG: thioredoxin-dependent thiol peroxidase [Deltaproteobacteria bacterium]|nr:MAG: thioredoxin-dependent thiol peroxidase [Deltaproteobacteria bacterium]
MLEVGDSPADFTLTDDRGNEVVWSELRGQPVVVFFYPKASTPGCTKEACAFRDLGAEFAARGVKVFGASADTVKRQSNFRDKYELTMPLLADEDHVILEPWGVWAEKKNYGKTYMGIVRSTFVFDAQGVLAHKWTNVRVNGHADKVLAKVDELFAEEN